MKMRGSADNAGIMRADIPGLMIFSAALGFGFMVLPAFSQPYPPPYPRPNATAIIDNDRVHAWDVYWIKNQPTPMHTHRIDQLSITLRGGLLRVRPGNGPWGKAHTSEAGSVTFVPAGTTHKEEGLSDIPQHKIMLEIKPSAADPDVHGTPPGPGAIKLLENARLVAWDLVWKKGQTISRPRETLDTVTVFLAGGTIDLAGNGSRRRIVRKPGDVKYARRGTGAHTEMAVTGSPHAVIVELK